MRAISPATSTLSVEDSDDVRPRELTDSESESFVEWGYAPGLGMGRKTNPSSRWTRVKSTMDRAGLPGLPKLFLLLVGVQRRDPRARRWSLIEVTVDSLNRPDARVEEWEELE
ncbi:hypothetical protein N9L68_07285 [bacterium]|nr:hypothetical protein [bacterium]